MAERAGEGASGGAPTPMMAQYIEIKAANPDCLLFYRMGDFYELFFEDAAIASKALGITLTKRGKHLGEDIPMAGVPVVSADDYLQKLIALGHRVAVCEQTEDPAEARKRGGKAVVRRDVVRIVTPGTITEETLLEPGRTNFLATLVRIGGDRSGTWGLAWADLSTGSFRLSQTSEDRLLADLAAIEPREIVIPEPLAEVLVPHLKRLGTSVRAEPQPLFDAGTAGERLCRHYGVSTLEGYGAFSRAELAAGAALLAYLGRTQIGERPSLAAPVRQDPAGILQIDQATRASLELARTVAGQRQGSLLWAIDRTVTGPGARLLATRLSAPLTDVSAIRGRQADLAVFLEAPQLRGVARALLADAPDIERALSRLALNRGGPRDLAAIRGALGAALSLADRLAEEDLPDGLASALARLRAVPRALHADLCERLADEVPVQRRDGGFVRPGADSELDAARTLAEDSRRFIAALQGRYVEETGVRSLKIRHNNVLGYFVEVPEGQGASVLATKDGDEPRFRHRQTLASAMRFSTAELADLAERIVRAGDDALAIEMRIFDELSRRTVAAGEALREAAFALAEIDVAAALAELALACDWCRPVIDESLSFRIEGGRHPTVEAALKAASGPAFVPNDCDLSEAGGGQAGAIWLLTGPNMGGKSTFLRQNALIAILAQIGSYVPATAAHLGVVDRLFSRVGASDELAEGRSTFMVEMVETAAILNIAGPRSLVILDEIGRGTSTYDGLSIAFAAVEHLHETNRCRALFATHFHELTALAKRLGRLVNVTMRVKEWEGEVVFLHEVVPGVADRSYGIQVARLAGLPKSVLARARDVLKQLEKGEQGGRRAAVIDDLPLFSAAALREQPDPEEPPTKPSALVEAVGAIDVDALSPREALETLYRLKEIAGSA